MTTPSMIMKRPAGSFPKSPAKWARKSEYATKENISIERTQDEQAMLDKLLAGIDASVFDEFGLSPVKPTKRATSQSLPLSLHEPNPSHPSSAGPLASRRSQSRRSPVPVVYDLGPTEKECHASESDLPIKTKLDIGPQSFDDTLLDIDFDMADMSAFEDDLETVPRPAVSSIGLRYRLTAGSISYPASRCTPCARRIPRDSMVQRNCTATFRRVDRHGWTPYGDWLLELDEAG